MQNDLSVLDDKELTARVADGDEQAIAVLYDRYATPAFSLALKLAGDPQRAADLVQRAFTRLWAEAWRVDSARDGFVRRLLSLVSYLASSPAALTPVPVPAQNGPAPLCLTSFCVSPPSH